MKRKQFKVALISAFAAVCAFGFVGCDDDSGHDSSIDPANNSTAISGPEEDYVASSLSSGYDIIPARPKTPSKVCYLGAKDFSSGFWTVFSPAWKITNQGVTRVSFFVYLKDGAKDYETWCSVFNQANADGSLGSEIMVSRGDVHCAPKPKTADDGTVSTDVTSIASDADSQNAQWSSCSKYVMVPSYTYDYTKFQSIMNMAYVTVDMYKNGTSLSQNITIQDYTGASYTASYKTSGWDCGVPSGDVLVRFFMEHAYYMFDVENCWHKDLFVDDASKRTQLDFGDLTIESYTAPDAATVLSVDESLVPSSPVSKTEYSTIKQYLGNISQTSELGDAKMSFTLDVNDKLELDFVNYGKSAVNSYALQLGDATIFANAYAEEGRYNTADEDSKYCGVAITDVDTSVTDKSTFKLNSFLAEANVHVTITRTGNAYTIVSVASDIDDPTQTYSFTAQSTSNTSVSEDEFQSFVLTNQLSYQTINYFTEYGNEPISIDPFASLYVALGGENTFNVSSVTIDGTEYAAAGAPKTLTASSWNAVSEFITVPFALNQTVSFTFTQPTAGADSWKSWALAFWGGNSDYTKGYGQFLRADNWFNANNGVAYKGNLYNAGAASANAVFENGYTYETAGKSLPVDATVVVSIKIDNSKTAVITETVNGAVAQTVTLTSAK